MLLVFLGSIASSLSNRQSEADHEEPASTTSEESASTADRRISTTRQFSRSSQAPQSLQDASALLGVATGLLEPLGASGWVVYGDVPSIPAGVCVDWPPGSGRLDGEAAWSVTKGADWERTLLDGSGSFTGPKVTLYWSPCQP